MITSLFYHILPLVVRHIGPLEPLLMRREGSLLACRCAELVPHYSLRECGMWKSGRVRGEVQLHVTLAPMPGRRGCSRRPRVSSSSRRGYSRSAWRIVHGRRRRSRRCAVSVVAVLATIAARLRVPHARAASLLGLVAVERASSYQWCRVAVRVSPCLRGRVPRRGHLEWL